MKKPPQILFCMSVVGVMLMAFASPAQANCTVLSQVVFHGQQGFIENCVEPATGFIYAIDDPVNTRSVFRPGHPSAGLPMVTVCNASAANGGDTDAGGNCQTNAGTIGDGRVTVQFDWGAGSAAAGCPNPSGAGEGTAPIAIDIVDASGQAVTLTMGYSTTTAGYLVEAAHLDAGTGSPLPISCSGVSGNITLGPINDVSATMRTVDVNVPLPSRDTTGVFSDCDPGAIGVTGGIGGQFQTCQGRSAGSTRGDVYTRIGPCANADDVFFRDVAGWTLAGSPDPSTGNLTVVTDPSQLAGNCANPPGICISPPSASGQPCATSADCDAIAEDCQYIGASNILGAELAGTCEPPNCATTSIGPCSRIADNFIRCSGDGFVTNCGSCASGPNTGNFCLGDSACNGVAGDGSCVADNNRCITGSCDSDGSACTMTSECDGICLSGTTGDVCSVDADCSDKPESSVIGDGAIRIAGPAAASDRAVARLAELGKNVLRVEFTVSLEQHAQSFDILAGGRAINDSPILADGSGSYVASIDKAGGKLKGAKEITVRTNLDGGGTLLSAPLAIKKGN
jgi:hypothetical protein